MPVQLTMPKLGLTMTEGVLSRWVAREGQEISKGQMLFEVETDKLVMEVEAEAGGVLHIAAEEGTTVPVLGVVGYLLTPGEEPAQIVSSPKDLAGDDFRTEITPPAPPPAEPIQRRLVSPAARRRARELGADIDQVQPATLVGRATAADAEAHAAQAEKAPEPIRVPVSGRWPDGLRDYQWWTVQKAVDLFTHAPAFIGIYSYEHSTNRPAGHRNVLFLKRGAPLRPIDRERKQEDDLPPNMWKWWEEHVFTQPGQKSVIVPHTFAAGPLADWNWPNARFDCLLEMYQGARGSYEAYKLPDKEKRGPTQVDEDGHYARNALAKGNIYGFVSFSDHGSTHNSWAGVWVLKEDREGVLDGIYARHTFAASDEIITKVTASGHMPGDEWKASGGKAPRIEANITAMDRILRVDVVKDGKYVYTMSPDGRTAAKLNWRDSEAKPGRSCYYVRVFQRDPENPDGDPEIAWTSPFYVTYQ
ncbi:MAG: hypothetical protein LC126_03830 [Bryobacterales bacterium]|nr:hypothetical protein [Bryobacterales bacterium]